MTVAYCVFRMQVTQYEITLQRKVAGFSLFWMQLNCILLAVQLLANEKLPDFAL